MYLEVFKEINLTKDKYKISNLLNQLLEIKPDENYIEDLKELTNKVREVKIDAIGLLSRYNNKELEDFFINKTESENDNFAHYQQHISFYQYQNRCTSFLQYQYPG